MKSIIKSQLLGKKMMYLYFLVLLMSMIIGGFGKYNSIPVILFTLLFAIYVRQINVCICVICIFLPTMIYSLINKSAYIHIVLDIIDFYFIFSSINILKYLSFSSDISKKIFKYSLFLIFLSVFGMIIPNLYSFTDGKYRYDGIFTSSGNTSASIFCILGILIWEIYKKYNICFNRKKALLLFLFLSYLLYVYVSETRTLLFAIPYWICQLLNTFSKKMVYLIGTVGLFLLSPSLISEIGEKMRIQDDASYNTRLYLYTMLIDGIKDNWVVIPHGCHKAWDLVRIDADSEGLSAHNDFLKYIYDWGITFIILLIFIYKRISYICKLNINVLLILLAVSSFALHNILFLPLTWIPLIFILFFYKKQC